VTTPEAEHLEAALLGDSGHFDALVEPHRPEIFVHCYRMLGSLQDAEDLVQESFLRAWRRRETYGRKASFRAWLYKIATNACLDMISQRKRTIRTLPIATTAASDPREPFSPPTPDQEWLEPLPDSMLNDVSSAPEAKYAVRESVELAFLVALQLLPPRQRSVLILRDVIDWSAKEVADHLETTVPAVNSSLLRARATLTAHYRAPDSISAQPDSLDEELQLLLTEYTAAWETADIVKLTALLKEDATFTMPPSVSWYEGRDAITTFLATQILPPQAAGVWRMLRTSANGQPAFGLYQLDPNSGDYTPFALHVLQVSEGQVSSIANFINPAVFPSFDLPVTLKV